jgi:hypothetical protein
VPRRRADRVDDAVQVHVDQLVVVVELDPVDDFARFALGRCLERQSRHAEALPHYRLAAAMRPDPEYLDAITRAEPRTT